MCGMQVIRVFHKKIHPESSIAAREFVNSHKYKVKKAPSGGYNNGDQMNLGEDNDGLTLEPMSKMGIQCCKTNLNAPRDGLHDSNLSAKEHWIMTDADCKYQFFFFGLVNYTRTEWVLNPQSHPPPTLVRGGNSI